MVRVSVIMAVYNGEKYLRESIDSILAQTFTDFEFVIIDDASTDSTASILKSYKDPRIHLIENDRNIGLTRSLNRGIGFSIGEYIARQDADDVSLPGRLSAQVAFLQTHPAIALVGAGVRYLNALGETLEDWQPQTSPEEIQHSLLCTVPFVHGTFLLRRSCLDTIGGGYDETMPVAQDAGLLLQLSDSSDLTNLPKILYLHRVHEERITAKRLDDQLHYYRTARDAAIRRRLKLGWGKIRHSTATLPDWVKTADRRWLARRCVWWSAGARAVHKWTAVEFIVIALLLDPRTPEIWSYVQGIIGRKLGRISLGKFLHVRGTASD